MLPEAVVPRGQLLSSAASFEISTVSPTKHTSTLGNKSPVNYELAAAAATT